MQDVIETIDCGNSKTINVYGPAWHSGQKKYIDSKEWARLEGLRVKVFSDRHRGSRKIVNGYRATVGNGYAATVATAHRRSDLLLWIGALSNLSADCVEFV